MELGLFYFDQLSILMLTVISIVGATVISFSKRYLDGDERKPLLIKKMTLIVTSLALVGVSDNLFIFILAWGVSNMVLIRLMIHKASWKAALHAGKLAGKNLLFGLVMISASLFILAGEAQTTSIQVMIHSSYSFPVLTGALICMTLGVMAQSAIWPFHRWLISSVNSPTPVSAIMHAGLVNGGGILLARMSPLYLDSPFFLEILFVMGLATAMIGTTWKLIQSDIKRMLACSTMGQMGFMVMQCGLGLFPAALTHLCMHGFFKAYLFLASGSAATEKRIPMSYPPQAIYWFGSLICGALGLVLFLISAQMTPVLADTSIFLPIIAFIVCVQLALTVLSYQPRFSGFLLALVFSALVGSIYGFGILAMEKFFEPMNILRPVALSWLHLSGLALLVGSWFMILLTNHFKKLESHPLYWKAYHWVLNHSQPAAKTMTSHRNDYSYQSEVKNG